MNKNPAPPPPSTAAIIAATRRKWNPGANFHTAGGSLLIQIPTNGVRVERPSNNAKSILRTGNRCQMGPLEISRIPGIRLTCWIPFCMGLNWIDFRWDRIGLASGGLDGNWIGLDWLGLAWIGFIRIGLTEIGLAIETRKRTNSWKVC